MRFRILKSYKRLKRSLKNLRRKSYIYGTSNPIKKRLFSKVRYLVTWSHVLRATSWICSLDSKIIERITVKYQNSANEIQHSPANKASYRKNDKDDALNSWIKQSIFKRSLKILWNRALNNNSLSSEIKFPKELLKYPNKNNQ